MLAQIQSWLAPPVFEGDEEKTNAAVVLNMLLLVAFAAVVLFLVAHTVFDQPIASLVIGVVIAMSVVWIGSFILLRLGYVRFVGMVMSAVLWVGITLPAINFGGMHDTAIVGYFVVIILAGITLGGSGLVVFTLLSVLAVAGIYAAEHLGLITPYMAIPSGLNDLILLVLLMGTSAVLLHYAVRRLANAYDRARRDAEALEGINVELEASRDALAAQTRQLERRTRYLEATAAVARDTTLELDIDELLPRLASLVSERLGFYHVGIFSLEPGGEWLELQAASSEGGRRMLARGHRLQVGEGIVGYVAQQRLYRLALDVGEDAVFFDNPDLPETHSEAALPLMARGDAIGVLDVQSTEPEAFNAEDMIALQALANQLTVAISNARLYWEAQRALEAERGAYGELSRRAWQEMLQAQPELAIVRDKQGISPVDFRPDAEVEQALKTGRVATSEGDPDDGQSAGLAVPIRVRGQVIGAIDAHKPADGGQWTLDQIALLETLSEQVGDALEDARLYQEAQRRAARDRLMSEVTARVRQTMDIDTVLKTTADEIYRALELDEVLIRLVVDEANERQPGRERT